MKHRGIVQTADKILELMTNQYQNSRKLYLRSIYEKKSNWNIKKCSDGRAAYGTVLERQNTFMYRRFESSSLRQMTFDFYIKAFSILHSFFK